MLASQDEELERLLKLIVRLDVVEELGNGLNDFFNRTSRLEKNQFFYNLYK